VREETFGTKIDAQHWREMIEATLEQRDKVTFDFDVYAAGLAQRRPQRAWIETTP
jgi:hypothetical protein